MKQISRFNHRQLALYFINFVMKAGIHNRWYDYDESELLPTFEKAVFEDFNWAEVGMEYHYAKAYCLERGWLKEECIVGSDQIISWNVPLPENHFPRIMSGVPGTQLVVTPLGNDVWCEEWPRLNGNESAPAAPISTTTQNRILEELDSAAYTAEELAKRLGLSVSTVKAALKELGESKRVDTRCGQISPKIPALDLVSADPTP